MATFPIDMPTESITQKTLRDISGVLDLICTGTPCDWRVHKNGYMLFPGKYDHEIFRLIVDVLPLLEKVAIVEFEDSGISIQLKPEYLPGAN